MTNDQSLEVPALPRTALEFQIVRIWEELLGRQPIGIQEDFFEVGGDSLTAMTLLVRIAQETKYTLPAGGILQAPTIEKLADFLQQQAVADTWSPLVPIQASGSRPPFFCVHPAGGNVLCYVQLAQSLGPDQPFFGLQAAGVDGIRPPLTSVEEMADEYIAAIRRVQPRGPYFVGGWSVGGIVAFEMAQQLVEQGEEIASVVLIDSGVLYASALLTALFSRGGLKALNVLQLPFATQVAEFRRYSAVAGLIPSAADDHVAGLIYRVFAANMRAVLNYRPRSLHARIDLLQASEPIVRGRFEPCREWTQLGHQVELRMVPGNHLTMVQAPHVELTARAMEAALSEAASRPYPRSRPNRPR
jgi:pyochelin synthetase